MGEAVEGGVMAYADKAELRRLAEACAYGDWFETGDLMHFDGKTGETHGLNAEDERLIAAATPARILALLNECESLHSALGASDEIKAEPAGDYETLRKQFMSLLMMANSKCRQVKYWREQSNHVQQQKIWENAANVNAERDTNAMLTESLLKAEESLEEFRKDAERYRWIRDQHNNPMGAFGVADLGMGEWTIIEVVMDTGQHDLDAAVDAAMQEAPKP
ncbi:hypothetical protein [Metapseudomonas otitidis]|uniref:hypothetical protein n=1 Tax=Metapseudomonas otitidis TaxID=319939 RepID=UPI00244BF7FD|nr:hypothetical protein [Pseudomonas otitidis]MDG9784947.1 hypothetical protein [Pseudomonas otitidis]